MFPRGNIGNGSAPDLALYTAADTKRLALAIGRHARLNPATGCAGATPCPTAATGRYPLLRLQADSVAAWSLAPFGSAERRFAVFPGGNTP